MFYKNRPATSDTNSRRSTNAVSNGTTRPADRTISEFLERKNWKLILIFQKQIFLGAQQFYIYTIDTNDRNQSQAPDQSIDLPPKYEDVIKEPHLYRREVV